MAGRYRARPVKSLSWTTARTTTASSHWVDRPLLSACILFFPQCRNGAAEQRFGNCAGGQQPQKTQRQAGTRNQKTERGCTQRSESAAAHEHLHGATAGKSFG